MEKNKRLSLNQWKYIIRNLSELDSTDEFGNEVEILWLEDTDEWVLCHGYELFEDGFKTEKEAWQRYMEILHALAKRIINEN